jgi:predicted ribosomally synthesized peptide with SipW-like signal peptide
MLGLVSGTGAVGTYAYWSDQATLTTGGFDSGTLDLTVDGTLAGQAGTYTKSAFTLSDMIPGESVASSLSLENGGSVALTYTATATASGALAPGLTFRVYTGGAASNSGTAAAGNRVGSCSGTSVFGPTTLTGSAASVIASARQLDPGDDETLCIVATLSSSAANALQGQPATASFVFHAQQLGAP